MFIHWNRKRKNKKKEKRQICTNYSLPSVCPYRHNFKITANSQILPKHPGRSVFKIKHSKDIIYKILTKLEEDQKFYIGI